MSLQPYQRQFLRLLTTNFNPNSTMCLTRKSSPVTTTVAPLGFRLLLETEIIQSGDHYLTTNFRRTFNDGVITYVGKTFVDVQRDPFNSNVEGIVRKIDVPLGYRLLTPTETVNMGDHYLNETFKRNGYNAISLRAGLSCEAAMKDHARVWGPGIEGIIRAVEIKTPVSALSITSKPPEKSLIDQAIDNLQTISLTTRDGVPEPHHVRAEMKKLVAATETPLRAETKEAREGCKRLSETVDRQRTKITALEDKLSTATAELGNKDTIITTQREELRKMKQNARGNVVILRRDGFSRPMDICPAYGFNGPEFPRYIKFHDQPEPSYADYRAGADYAKVSFRTLEAVNTGRKDGFGRVIFEQV